jgi:hypothetical protein
MALHTDCQRPPYGASFLGYGLTPFAETRVSADVYGMQPGLI